MKGTILFTEREQKQILKIKKTIKKTPFIITFLCLFIIFIVVSNLFFIHRVTNLMGVTVKYAFMLGIEGPQFNRSYEGFEVFLAGRAQQVIFFPALILIMAFMIIVSFNRDKLLIKCWQKIEELEKEQK